MIKVLGLNINVNDFLAQVGHAFTVIAGLFFANQASLPVGLVTDVNSAISSGTALYNDLALYIHSAGWVGVALGIYNWLQHNAAVTSPVTDPPVIPASK